MIALFGIGVGLIFAWLATRHGFYAMWAILVNVIIAVYLAVMLTPTAADTILDQDSSLYAYAAILGGIAIVAFVILQTLATTFLTGTFDVELPKIFNNIGAALLGFFTGMITWGFVCFMLLIMPATKDYLADRMDLGDDLKKVSYSSVARACELVNTLSCQNEADAVRKAMDASLDIAIDTDQEIEPNSLDESTILQQDTDDQLDY